MACKTINGVFVHSDDCSCDLDYMTLKEAQEYHQNEAYNSYFENDLNSGAYDDY